ERLVLPYAAAGKVTAHPGAGVKLVPGGPRQARKEQGPTEKTAADCHHQKYQCRHHPLRMGQEYWPVDGVRLGKQEPRQGQKTSPSQYSAQASEHDLLYRLLRAEATGEVIGPIKGQHPGFVLAAAGWE